MIALAVALAGGVGAVLRFLAERLMVRIHLANLHIGTTLINMTGSFLLGLLVGLCSLRPGGETLQAVLGTGLLGGYTTFSAASVETIRIAKREGRGSVPMAVCHAGGMLLMSCGAAWAGLWLGQG